MLIQAIGWYSQVAMCVVDPDLQEPWNFFPGQEPEFLISRILVDGRFMYFLPKEYLKRLGQQQSVIEDCYFLQKNYELFLKCTIGILNK